MDKKRGGQSAEQCSLSVVGKENSEKEKQKDNGSRAISRRLRRSGGKD